MSLSQISCQMMRVISSPSSSITGFVTLILGILRGTLVGGRRATCGRRAPIASAPWRAKACTTRAACGFDRPWESDRARRARVLPGGRRLAPTPVPRSTMRSRLYAGSSKRPPRRRGCQPGSSPSSSGGRARSGRPRSAPRARKGWRSSCRGRRTSGGSIDPFDPAAAIPASAKFLNELKLRFGNLGLAAAAYNAGQTAVAHWLAKKGSLPFETEDYVLAVTGHDAEEWRSDKPPADPAPIKVRPA